MAMFNSKLLVQPQMGSSDAHRAAPSGVLDDAMRSRDIGQHGVADLGQCHMSLVVTPSSFNVKPCTVN